MQKILLFGLFLFFVKTIHSQDQKFQAAGYEMEILGDFGSFTFSTKRVAVKSDLEIITLTLKSEEFAMPPKFQVKWSLPSRNIAGHGSTAAGSRKLFIVGVHGY